MAIRVLEKPTPQNLIKDGHPVLEIPLPQNVIKDGHRCSRNTQPQIQTKPSNRCNAALPSRVTDFKHEGHKPYGLIILAVLLSFSSKMPWQ